MGAETQQDFQNIKQKYAHVAEDQEDSKINPYLF